MNKAIRYLLNELVFLAGSADCLSGLPSDIKNFNTNIRSLTNVTLAQASTKINEKVVYSNLQDKRKKQAPKFKLGPAFRTCDIMNVFSKAGSTKYSSEIYDINGVIHNTFPSYRINHLPKKHQEIFLLRTKLTLDEIKQIMKELNENQ